MEPAPLPELTIKNYADWLVGAASQDCEDMGLTLKVTNPDPKRVSDPEAAQIKENATSSPPCGPIQAGGIVNVVIYHLEPKQGS